MPRYRWNIAKIGVKHQLINQSNLSPLKLRVRIPLMAMCTPCNIMWSSLSVVCSRSVAFSRYSDFHHQSNWPPRYNCNIAESHIEHHNPKPTKSWFMCFVAQNGFVLIPIYISSNYIHKHWLNRVLGDTEIYKRNLLLLFAG